MRNAIKHIVGATWQPLLVKYLSRPRTYRYKNIVVDVPVSVFHPGFFFSTHILLNQVKRLALNGKKFLEPGAGSGLLSIYAARMGANVTATDINPAAVECLKRNSSRNGVRMNIIESDLFDSLPAHPFDVIAINPPYYRKRPLSHADYAWNCGENGEYFEKLFGGLGNYLHSKTEILMVLCDGSDIEMIKSIAKRNGFQMHLLLSKESIIEKNFIYSIE